MTDKDTVYRDSVAAACLVIVVAGMRAARSLVVPFLLACFFAVILAPVLHWMHSKGVRTAFALLIILSTFVLLGTGLSLFVGKSFNDFTDKLPEYEKSLTEQIGRDQALRMDGIRAAPCRGAVPKYPMTCWVPIRPVLIIRTRSFLMSLGTLTRVRRRTLPIYPERIGWTPLGC